MKRVALWLVPAFAAGVPVGCLDDGPIGDVGEKCGLGCPDEGIASGNASISGIVEIDAFFGAVVDLVSASASVRAGIGAELDAMALSVGLPRGSAGADIATAVSNKISAATASGLQMVFEEPVCQASVEVAANAAAECDVEVDPGTVTVACEGRCAAETETMVDCGANAQLTCEGGAPNFQCEGTCSGDCELTVEAACDGVCRGSCNGTCTVMDQQGNCAGECDGMCQGTCELEAGGTCSGSCHGTCRWTPPDAMCEAGIAASCEAQAGGSVECGGRCEGTAAPPMVKAECEATVQAKADSSLECAPPRVTVRWQWSAAYEGDTAAQGEFRAWLAGLEGQAAALMGKGVKGDIIINGFTEMSEAADAAVRDGATAALEGDLKAKIGARCALTQLPEAISLMSGETTELFDSLQQASTVLAVLDSAGSAAHPKISGPP